MTPREWLEHNVPGFHELDEAERNEIYSFTMLWSFFESRCLGKWASPRAIEDFIQRSMEAQSLQVTQMKPHMAYFQDRYIGNNGVTEHFAGLHLREDKSRERVQGALEGVLTSEIDCLYALFMIIYRFRNNLLHGEKWEYGIRGQKENFEHANQVLMIAMS